MLVSIGQSVRDCFPIIVTLHINLYYFGVVQSNFINHLNQVFYCIGQVKACITTVLVRRKNGRVCWFIRAQQLILQVTTKRVSIVDWIKHWEELRHRKSNLRVSDLEACKEVDIIVPLPPCLLVCIVKVFQPHALWLYDDLAISHECKSSIHRSVS